MFDENFIHVVVEILNIHLKKEKSILPAKYQKEL